MMTVSMGCGGVGVREVGSCQLPIPVYTSAARSALHPTRAFSFLGHGVLLFSKHGITALRR